MTRVANIRLKLSDFIETDLEDIIMSRIKSIEQKLSMKFVLYFWLDTDINLKAFYDRWKDNLSRIAEAHPQSNLAKTHLRRSTKQVKTEEVLKKHRKRIK